MMGLLPTPSNGTRPFDDPRGRLSEELAFEAETAAKDGDTAKSVVLYAEAAELEEEAARDVSEKRIRCVLAESAVALWLKAGKRDEAERVATEFGVADSVG